MDTSDVLSIIALVISFGTAIVIAFTNIINKKMFKREQVIDLFKSWSEVSDIDSDELITPDVLKAANALALTSTIWNHDIIEKTIIFQTYWEPFRDLYDKLYSITKCPPGLNKTCKSMISADITKAYKAMEAHQLKKIKQTNV